MQAPQGLDATHGGEASRSRAVRGWASTTFRFLDFNFVTRDRQKAPEIAPLFNAFQRAGPRPENSFLYLLGHIVLASIRASSAPWLQPRSPRWSRWHTGFRPNGLLTSWRG